MELIIGTCTAGLKRQRRQLRQHRVSNCRSHLPACGWGGGRGGGKEKRCGQQNLEAQGKGAVELGPRNPRSGGSPPAALVSQVCVSTELSPRLPNGGHWLFGTSISLWHCFLDQGKNSVLESAALIRLDNDFYGDSDRRMEPKRKKQSRLILQPSGLPPLTLLAEFTSWQRSNGACRASAPAPRNREEDSGLRTSIRTAFLLER